MTAKFASLTGWRLGAAVLGLGLASYFAISTVLRAAASFIPVVSGLGAAVIVGWVLLAGHRDSAESE